VHGPRLRHRGHGRAREAGPVGTSGLRDTTAYTGGRRRVAVAPGSISCRFERPRAERRSRPGVFNTVQVADVTPRNTLSADTPIEGLIASTTLVAVEAEADLVRD